MSRLRRYSAALWLASVLGCRPHGPPPIAKEDESLQKEEASLLARRGALQRERKRLVDEVQLKTNVIVNMLEDVRLNMESLGEHKAVMDHVMASFNRLNEMVQESQSTLRALQAERELAERIERGNKQLRSKTGGDEAKKFA